VTKDETDRMFERFYRSQDVPSRVTGVGIGLTVCRRLIEAQNGRIWAEPREGGGLVVSFTLPVCPD
jgi:signal transduction histidine kinase